MEIRLQARGPRHGERILDYLRVREDYTKVLINWHGRQKRTVGRKRDHENRLE